MPELVINDRRHHAKRHNEMLAHPIPIMSDPLGRHWTQPHRSEIAVDKTHALMSKEAFLKLPEYSATQPSGVYVGKMWRRHNGSFDRAFLASGGKPEWLLCWYDVSDRGPDWCTTRMRSIVLSDADINEVK